MQQGPDLIFVGYGVSDTLQLTVEAQRALTRFGKVYALHVPPNLKRYLKSLQVECINLADRFSEKRPFSEVYLGIADFILQCAAVERPVIFLTQGNPLFLNSLNRFLLMQAKQRKLSVQVYPGVSPLDALVCDLGLDISTFGLQIFDARRLVTRKQQINPTVPLLVLQLAGFAVEEAGPQPEPDPKEYQPLASYLAQFYPPEHPVSLVNTAYGQKRGGHATVRLSRLLDLVPHVGTTSHLFIDAIRQGPLARPQERPEK